MNRLHIVTIAAIVLGVAACSAQKSVGPADVRKQAYEDLRTSMRAAIADQEREDAAIEILGQLESDVHDLHESLTRRRAELRRLHVDYDTTREELIAFSYSIEREIQQNQQRASKTHQELIAVTTPEEWDKLTKADTKAMNAITQSLQGM